MVGATIALNIAILGLPSRIARRAVPPAWNQREAKAEASFVCGDYRAEGARVGGQKKLLAALRERERERL